MSQGQLWNLLFTVVLDILKALYFESVPAIIGIDFYSNSFNAQRCTVKTK